jgi:hypothetical protein
MDSELNSVCKVKGSYCVYVTVLWSDGVDSDIDSSATSKLGSVYYFVIEKQEKIMEEV